MKVLVDCSNIKTGGALQNGLSFIKMARNDTRHEWYVAVSADLEKQIPSDWKNDFNIFQKLPKRRTLIDFIQYRRIMLALEKQVTPDVIFSIAGPAYWRGKNIHICGFAIPHFLYPEIDIYKNVTGLKYWKLKILLFCILTIQKYHFRKFDYLICQTITVKKRAKQALGFPESCLFVVRNSFSPIFKEEKKKKKGILKEPENLDQRFIILIPSAWYWHKNLEIIPTVAFNLKNNGFNQFLFRLTISSESVAWSNIRTLSAKLNVEEHVTTAGKVPHLKLAKEYLYCNAVFLPTLLECSTAVYPEAMYAGAPIVTSDLDFAHDACGEAALYFNPFNAKDAADKIVQLINNDELRKKLISQGCKELSLRFPTPEQKYEEQLIILTEVLNRGRQNLF